MEVQGYNNLEWCEGSTVPFACYNLQCAETGVSRHYVLLGGKIKQKSTQKQFLCFAVQEMLFWKSTPVETCQVNHQI